VLVRPRRSAWACGLAELFRRRQDAPPRLLGHAGLTVQREAGRGHRHPGQPGDLTDPARPRPAVVARHGLPGPCDQLIYPDKAYQMQVNLPRALPDHPGAGRPSLAVIERLA
jgi:hypothetical protein